MGRWPVKSPFKVAGEQNDAMVKNKLSPSVNPRAWVTVGVFRWDRADLQLAKAEKDGHCGKAAMGNGVYPVFPTSAKSCVRLGKLSCPSPKSFGGRTIKKFKVKSQTFKSKGQKTWYRNYLTSQTLCWEKRSKEPSEETIKKARRYIKNKLY